jgi:hypothetical protein
MLRDCDFHSNSGGSTKVSGKFNQAGDQPTGTFNDSGVSSRPGAIATNGEREYGEPMPGSGHRLVAARPLTIEGAPIGRPSSSRAATRRSARPRSGSRRDVSHRRESPTRSTPHEGGPAHRRRGGSSLMPPSPVGGLVGAADRRARDRTRPRTAPGRTRRGWRSRSSDRLHRSPARRVDFACASWGRS